MLSNIQLEMTQNSLRQQEELSVCLSPLLRPVKIPLALPLSRCPYPMEPDLVCPTTPLCSHRAPCCILTLPLLYLILHSQVPVIFFFFQLLPQLSLNKFSYCFIPFTLFYPLNILSFSSSRRPNLSASIQNSIPVGKISWSSLLFQSKFELAKPTIQNQESLQFCSKMRDGYQLDIKCM